MRSWIAAMAALAAVTPALVGCSGDDTVAETPASAPVSESSSPSPSPSPSSSPSSSPSPSVSETPSPSPSPTATPTPSPTATPTRGAQQGLRSARTDVRTISPQLLDYYTQREFPLDLRQLRETLDGADVSLTAGNSIGGYGLAGDGMNFVLCVQHDGGGWASYNTAAGKVDDSGVSGSCPAG